MHHPLVQGSLKRVVRQLPVHENETIGRSIVLLVVLAHFGVGNTRDIRRQAPALEPISTVGVQELMHIVV